MHCWTLHYYQKWGLEWIRIQESVELNFTKCRDGFRSGQRAQLGEVTTFIPIRSDQIMLNSAVEYLIIGGNHVAHEPFLPAAAPEHICADTTDTLKTIFVTTGKLVIFLGADRQCRPVHGALTRRNGVQTTLHALIRDLTCILVCLLFYCNRRNKRTTKNPICYGKLSNKHIGYKLK